MTDKLKEAIDRLRRLVEAATPGPWMPPRAPEEDNGHDITSPGAKPWFPTVAGNYDYEGGGVIRREDRDAIIALRNAADALIEVAEAAQDMFQMDRHMGSADRLRAAMRKLEGQADG